MAVKSSDKSRDNEKIRKSGMGTSVFMMEMIAVIFFFCLCAAVSALLFAKADNMSRLAADINQAVTKAESIGEIFKAGELENYKDYEETAGGIKEGAYLFAWNSQWEPEAAVSEGENSFPYYGTVEVSKSEEGPGFIETAVIKIIRNNDEKELYELTVSRYSASKAAAGDT